MNTHAPPGAGPPPPAPGALGEAIPAGELLGYLAALIAWRDRFRNELDLLDERAKAAEGAAEFSGDVTLAFALWQSVATRVDELSAAWDSGRADRRRREAISGLIWGRLDRSPDSLPVNFVEACILGDALVARLTERLDADVMAGSGIGSRVAQLRAALARCREQAAVLGLPVDAAADLSTALDALLAGPADTAAVRAEFDRIDAAASVLERDLIIAGAARTSLARQRASLADRLAAAAAAADTARTLAARCTEKIVAAPTLAVPDPESLGPVPSGDGDWRTARAAADAYADRLGQVETALREATRRYSAPLEERAELRGLLDAYRAKASRFGLAEDHALMASYDQARDVLWHAPCDLAVARDLVGAYQHEVTERAAGPGAAKTSDDEER